MSYTQFKFGATTFEAASKWQVEDYALDLRDFHLESNGRSIIPVLVATDALASESIQIPPGAPDSPIVWPVLGVRPAGLASYLASAFAAAHRPEKQPIDPNSWNESKYRPSPLIIEAAKRLFAGHSVREISHAYADNLSVTTDALVGAIDMAQRDRLRAICFVTGVPGAGKTLTGLNAVHSPARGFSGERTGVFLSGNGPLVRIVQAALVQDTKARGLSLKDARREVGTFVQNVHSFMDEYTRSKPNEAPCENVVVFDEAQRAWDAKQVKKKRGIDRSEPKIMLDIMERCPGWCVVVALVGGGQEIHTGEAGLEEWGQALAHTTARWRVHVSPEVMSGGTSLAGHCLFSGPPPSNCHLVATPKLHLDVTVRSFRAQMVTEWVNSLLAGDARTASDVIDEAREFPLVITRDLESARAWLRQRSRGEHRCGLVVSSGSMRRRAYGIEVSSAFRRGYPYQEWFLAEADDMRSSFQLEAAATEFECQGLELDWVGICWGDDLCRAVDGSRWRFRQFRGKSWQAVKNQGAQQYLLNKYRVLLTRAREGVVIWVPPGSKDDPTRDPELLDATADYLIAGECRCFKRHITEIQ